MNTTLRAALLAATALIAFPALAADDTKTDAAAPAAAAKPAESTKDYTVLKVNSTDIKNSEILDTWKSLFPEGSAPDFGSFDENIKQNVLRGIASEHLIYDEAIKAGTDKDADVKKRIAAMEKQVIMQSYMEEKSKTLVTDDQLHKAYDAKVSTMKGVEEVKARHILVATEAEAKTISGELKKGGDFDKLAKSKSTDKGSGAKGGELGWFTKDKMVPEFADAAFKLKKGEISDPVKSPFGWHVIQVEDRRAVKTPSLDEMKESLRGELTNKAVQDYVEGLLKGADIKYYAPDGKEKPLSRSLTPLPPKDKEAVKDAKDAASKDAAKDAAPDAAPADKK